MAEVTLVFLSNRGDDVDDDDHLLPQHSHLTMDFDPFPPSNPSFSPRVSAHEGDFSSVVDSSIPIPGEDQFYDCDSIEISDLLDRQNQVNFVMDLFHQRVEQSQAVDDRYLVFDSSPNPNDSRFGTFDEDCDVCANDLGMDLGLGLGFDGERHSLRGDEDYRFMSESHVCMASSAAQDDDEDYDFLFRRRASGYETGEPPSIGCGTQTCENCRISGFGSDSDEGENEVLHICLHSDEEDNFREDVDDFASIPLCWDSLHLEDHRETNEDFEWEEVDGRVDEREILSMFAAEDERSVSVSLPDLVPTIGPEEEEVTVVRMGENLEWEVLLNDLDHIAERYLGSHDDYIHTAEYETMLGQFTDNQNPVMGLPPASKSVVQNLPSVFLTKEDVENNSALCAVCKDDICIGEQAKQLPCSHRYHGDCIIPWLNIRNTCPVCRYELPTDDTEYEHSRRRVERYGHAL